MRFAACAFIALAFSAACDRKEIEQPAEPAPSAAVETAQSPASDELRGLPAPATGIAFWDHPTLSFNGTMIVATSAGVIAYSMEDGNVVSRIDGFNADGVATGYIGFGPQAVGFVTFLDADENVFQFYGVDNNSRLFIPLDSGPAVRGGVRGFCMGRSAGSPAPVLYVVQNGKVQIFELAGNASGVIVANEAILETPNNLVNCAVDIDGSLLLAADDGVIYKAAGANGLSTPFARATVGQAGDLSVISVADSEDSLSVNGQILFTDLANGVVHIFDSASGETLGAVRISATDSFRGVDSAGTFAATGGNLGGLYRNGVVAFGVVDGEDGPVIRIAPTSSLKNALSLPVGDPVSPRGAAPVEDKIGLDIPTTYEPE